MKTKNRILFSFLAVLLVLTMCFGSIHTVFADEVEPTDITTPDDTDSDTNDKTSDDADVSTWSMDGEKLPVIQDDAKCKLIIDYYDDLDANLPITTAVFTIYKVADMNEYGGFDSLIEGIDFSKAAGKEEEYCSNANIEVVKQQVKPIGTLITDPKGHAEIELEKGLYLVQETIPAPYHKESVPFLAQLPVIATNEDTNEYLVNDNGEMYWKYEVRVMPKSLPTGHVMVTKFVKGGNGELNRSFHFVINFEAEGEFDYQTTAGTKGKIKSGDTIELKSGEYVIINDLPSGCKYEVTEVEANKDGYVTDYVANTGNVVRFKSIDCQIINTKNKPPKTNDMIPIYVVIGVAVVSFGILLLTKKRKNK